MVNIMGLLLTSCDICKKCKFYQALYTKEETRYKTLMGRCINDNVTRHRKKNFPDIINCEFMEQVANNTSEQNASIRKEITDMRKKLTQILEILENKE